MVQSRVTFGGVSQPGASGKRAWDSSIGGGIRPRSSGVPGLCLLSSVTPETTSPALPCSAKSLTPQPRQQRAVHGRAGTQPISHLAAEHQVSRKFVSPQADKAEEVLHDAFDPAPADDLILFPLPVTKAWLRPSTLGLVLICHRCLRGVSELLRDLFDYPRALGTVCNMVPSAIPQARARNTSQDLAGVRIGVAFEIFQAGHPVLVGGAADSTYCYLLSQEEHRDADPWAVRRGELVERGFCPEATGAEGGGARRAAHERVLPDRPRRRALCHVFSEEVGPLCRALEARAYHASERRGNREEQRARPGKRRDRRKLSLAQQLRYARVEEVGAITRADDVALLPRWRRADVLAVAGLDHAGRGALDDFVLSELRARQDGGPHRVKPVCTALTNQRDGLLAFAAHLGRDLAAVAQECQVPVALTREALQVQALSVDDVRRGPRAAALRQALRGRYHLVSEAVAAVAAAVVRASSVVENLNRRLRTYFLLRRPSGADYLALLPFFLNHRRCWRSEQPGRAGKSPAELLTGAAHAQGLELLGYQRFVRPWQRATLTLQSPPRPRRGR
jgi:hypothetical protein